MDITQIKYLTDEELANGLAYCLENIQANIKPHFNQIWYDAIAEEIAMRLLNSDDPRLKD
ncbi:hypothetical protein L0B53_00900 [Vibrio sp. SS-MA-C1-2]|uniref:hypothetical protein n=1 Tax=Vibrio sp. SS-MA-C1-2 TaxID=2908646 RepID=UPI001F1B732A|nr:hypothetical protein [Vibrio sp. SS-MA-C1-2]UJF17367.1 hypothetical protein L0B53_00900 [Vibrio sp. SS-MA-C1-2]